MGSFAEVIVASACCADRVVLGARSLSRADPWMGRQAWWKTSAAGWAEFLEILERRLGMFTGRATYERAVAMVIGFDLAQDQPIHPVIQKRVTARNGYGSIGWPWVLRSAAPAEFMTRSLVKPQVKAVRAGGNGASA
jgi:hypothetical protein